LGGAGEPADRFDFLYSTGDWANDAGTHPKDADGVTTTGLGTVDIWVGGLAEQIMPFGSMLGSTFQFVFETQLENLQSGDRFYYLSRTAGLHFGTELESNSFAKMVMANTNVTHLPADIFSTPTFFLDVNPANQFNQNVAAGPDGIFLDDPFTLVNEAADNLPGNTDPVNVGPFAALIPLVIRDNPATPVLDTNYLQ